MEFKLIVETWLYEGVINSVRFEYETEKELRDTLKGMVEGYKALSYYNEDELEDDKSYIKLNNVHNEQHLLIHAVKEINIK